MLLWIFAGIALGTVMQFVLLTRESVESIWFTFHNIFLTDAEIGNNRLLLYLHGENFHSVKNIGMQNTFSFDKFLLDYSSRIINMINSKNNDNGNITE